MRRPDFFIVGAPKCGTTALYQYLLEHPQVFVPRGGGRSKEPHFFCPDLYSPRYVHDQARYEALFDSPEADAALRVGEASVFYLYSDEAPERIRAYSPDARIIIMLRDPAQMVYSLHSQRLFSGHEDIEDFEEALEAEPDRRRGRRLPAHGHPYKALFYREMGRYSDPVRRYFDAFGRDRVHVVVYDDFKADTARSYAEVLRFLEVDDGHRPSFDVVNPNKRIRSQRLRDFLKFSRWSGPIRGVARVTVPKGVRNAVAARINDRNTEYVQRPPMREPLRTRLRADFAEDVQALSQLLGRDLGHWVR